MNTERLLDVFHWVGSSCYTDWIPVSIGCGSLVVEGHVDKKRLKT